MEEVKRDVLSWDVDSIVASGRNTMLSKIPTFFESLEQYSRIFWKLLVEELRAHLQQVSFVSRICDELFF